MFNVVRISTVVYNATTKLHAALHLMSLSGEARDGNPGVETQGWKPRGGNPGMGVGVG